MIVAGSIAEHRSGGRGERGGRVGIHHRQRDLRRPAAGGAVHRRAGPPRPRRDGRGRRRSTRNPHVGSCHARADVARRPAARRAAGGDNQFAVARRDQVADRGRTVEAVRGVPGDGAGSGPGPGRGGLCLPPSRVGQLCRRTPANAAWARLDAELPRDDRERRCTRRDAGSGRGFRAVLEDRRPAAARPGRHRAGGGAGAYRRRGGR